MDRVDALGGRFAGSIADLMAIEHAGARYGVSTDFANRTDPTGKVTAPTHRPTHHPTSSGGHNLKPSSRDPTPSAEILLLALPPRRPARVDASSNDQAQRLGCDVITSRCPSSRLATGRSCAGSILRRLHKAPETDYLKAAPRLLRTGNALLRHLYLLAATQRPRAEAL